MSPAHCPRCGYELDPSVQHIRCPECGGVVSDRPIRSIAAVLVCSLLALNLGCALTLIPVALTRPGWQTSPHFSAAHLALLAMIDVVLLFIAVVGYDLVKPKHGLFAIPLLVLHFLIAISVVG